METWSQFGECGGVSCLGFGMEPLLVETCPGGSNAGDAEGLARSHCLRAGLHLHLKVLFIYRGQRRAPGVGWGVQTLATSPHK